MEEGSAFDVALECPVTAASALLFDCGCHDDWLLVDIFCFEDIGALLWCWVDFEYASTQY
jgi:hypothetical protein